MSRENPVCSHSITNRPTNRVDVHDQVTLPSILAFFNGSRDDYVFSYIQKGSRTDKKIYKSALLLKVMYGSIGKTFFSRILKCLIFSIKMNH